MMKKSKTEQKTKLAQPELVYHYSGAVEKEKKDFDFSSLMKYVPLGGIFLILLSSLKLVIFYKVFNISIVNYLHIQEYIPLFIDDILEYIFVFGIVILFVMILNPKMLEFKYLEKADLYINLKFLFVLTFFISLATYLLLLIDNFDKDLIDSIFFF